MRDRAVAVMKDVLQRIENVDYYPQCVRRMHTYFVRTTCSLPRRGDLRDFLEKGLSECQFCALGAILVSKAALYDQVPMRKLTDGTAYVPRSALCDAIQGVFTTDDTLLIEWAFEGVDCGLGAEEGVTPVVLALKLKARVWLSRVGPISLPSYRRLEAIAQNVVDNDGIFNLSVPPDTVYIREWEARAASPHHVFARKRA
jgi:hypothetical protein